MSLPSGVLMMMKAGMFLAKSEGRRVIFQKEFKKRACDSRHKRPWEQRLRGMASMMPSREHR